jgi:hypothetical protein
MKDIWKVNLMTMVLYIALHVDTDPSMETLEMVGRLAIIGLYLMVIFVFVSELEH